MSHESLIGKLDKMASYLESLDSGSGEAALIREAIADMGGVSELADSQNGDSASVPPTSDSLHKCPKCDGPADNGHDRCLPPNPYFCTKCMTMPQYIDVYGRPCGESDKFRLDHPEIIAVMEGARPEKHDPRAPMMAAASSANADQREISATYELTQRIEESLAYFCDEFPKDKRPDVWKEPLSHHCGGITPDDLQTLLSILYASNPMSGEAMDALHELVLLKQIKDEYGECIKLENTAIAQDYRDRKPKAWERAKSILKAVGEPYAFD